MKRESANLLNIRNGASLELLMCTRASAHTPPRLGIEAMERGIGLLFQSLLVTYVQLQIDSSMH